MPITSEKYIFAVGQRSFEIGVNHFSTLVPVATSDGEVVDNSRSQFPNRGRVWWMVRGDSRVTLAPPGCLLMAGVEESVERTSDPTKDWFQALQPSLPRPDDVVEILSPRTNASDPNDLLDGFRMRCDHEPTRYVLVRLGEHLYGPLRVDLSETASEREDRPEVSFSKPSPPHKVYRLSNSAVTGRSGYFSYTTRVWPGDRMLGEDGGQQVSYEAVTGALFRTFQEQGEEVELVSTLEAVRQVSGAFLGRKKRQEFVEQFSAFVQQSDISDLTLERAKRALSRQADQVELLNEFFKGLLSDKLFEPRIEAAVDAAVDFRVAEMAAQLDARAQERVRELTQRRSDLESQIREDEARFGREKLSRERDLESELQKRRDENEAIIQGKIKELEQLEEVVTGSLRAVSERLERDRGSLINEYLALEPLLQRLLPVTASSVGPGAATGALTPTKTVTDLVLPNVTSRTPRASNLLEEEFFDRLVGHVAASGFRFEADDLLAFHLSAKERAPVILGGRSGTGKSSLPALYSEALAGEELEANLLVVDVNPSWTSPSDLFGYTDALEHRFVPSASRLYHRLIGAAHEHASLGPDASLYTVCFDEMNLAQPEHYMADLIQAISRSPGQQSISVFDPGAVKPDDPYRKFAQLTLTPNLILCGTVNFDETTKPLSLRLLDRCNLIEFRQLDALPSLSTEASIGTSRAGGPAVREADFKQWTRNTSVLPRVVEVLGELQPELQKLGCPITPRRQSSILRFVANAPANLCTIDTAIDLQLKQRVLPQLRGLYRPGAVQTLQRLASKLEKICSAPRTAEALAQLEQQERDLNESFVLSEE